MRRPRTEARSGDWMTQKGLTNRGPLQKPDLGGHGARSHALHIKEKGGVNADVFIEFLKRLMVGATHPIFLIVDRGPAHRAKKTNAFVETLGGKLRLFFLPPYSPDRNPDELVWKHLKADTVGRSAIQSYADFKGKVKSSMHSLQRNTKKIRSFFAKDTLRYAA